MKLSAEASSNITRMSVFATLLVVGCHAGHWPSEGGVAARVFPSFFLFCAVPWFFFVSGLMMFKSYSGEAGWWLSCVRKRFFSLYIPFVISVVASIMVAYAIKKVSPQAYGVICGGRTAQVHNTK